MKRLAATALALGAVAAFATPAQAAEAELALASTWTPVTVKVNGKPVVVDGGYPGGYDWTIVKVTVGAKVTLEAQANPDGQKFCYWNDFQNRNRIRTVTIRGGSSDNYTTVYGRLQDC